MITEFELGDTVKTKKKHPCGSDLWKVIRVGADVKLKCLECGRIVMLDRQVFIKMATRVSEPLPH